MRGVSIIGVASICVLTASTWGFDEPAKDKAVPGVKLVGTWKLVSGKYGGNEFKFPEGTTMLKHVTPTQFMWATYDKDGKVFRAAGGFYTLKGDTYEETPEYGLSSDFDLINSKTHTFKAKVGAVLALRWGNWGSGLGVC